MSRGRFTGSLIGEEAVLGTINTLARSVDTRLRGMWTEMGSSAGTYSTSVFSSCLCGFL